MLTKNGVQKAQPGAPPACMRRAGPAHSLPPTRANIPLSGCGFLIHPALVTEDNAREGKQTGQANKLLQGGGCVPRDDIAAGKSCTTGALALGSHLATSVRNSCVLINLISASEHTKLHPHIKCCRAANAAVSDLSSPYFQLLPWKRYKLVCNPYRGRVCGQWPAGHV